MVAANFADVFVSSLAAALNSFLSFVPALVGAIVILIIGWILARILSRVVEAALMRVGFEGAASRSGLLRLVSRTGAGEIRASHVVALLVLWFIRLIFIEAAANAVHLTEVSVLLNSIILFIPNLLVALLTILIGALVAKLLASLVRAWTAGVGVGDPDLLARATQFGVISLAVLVALDQVGIATVIVDSIFIAFAGGIALAFALAFGLGGRETASQILRQWYTRSERASADADLQMPPPAAPPEGGRDAGPRTPGSYESPDG